MKSKNKRWPLLIAIGMMMAIIIFGLVITDLMRLEIIPRDWYVFHDYLNRTGNVKVYTYIAAILLIVITTILPFRLKLITKKSAYLIAFWFLLSNAIDAFGNFMGWYAVGKAYSVPWYDDFAHIMGGFIYASIAWIIWTNLLENKRTKTPLRFKIALAVLTSIVLGTMYGVYEYYSDMFRGTYMTGGAADVITDSVFDIIGALLAGFFLFVHYFRDRKTQLRKKSPYSFLTSIRWAD